MKKVTFVTDNDNTVMVYLDGERDGVLSFDDEQGAWVLNRFNYEEAVSYDESLAVTLDDVRWELEHDEEA